MNTKKCIKTGKLLNDDNTIHVFSPTHFNQLPSGYYHVSVFEDVGMDVHAGPISDSDKEKMEFEEKIESLEAENFTLAEERDQIQDHLNRLIKEIRCGVCVKPEPEKSE